MNELVHLAPEIEEALRRGRPIVALESAVITTGLPRSTLPDAIPSPDSTWNRNAPVNLETARLLERTVRETGAVPATIALMDGRLRLGLSEQELERIAADEAATKISASGLAHTAARGGSAGTTVSATLLACASPRRCDPALPMIRFFATGGIGGVHRGWRDHPDISADLAQLARTPVCVISAGAKSILDLPATLEALEALGVPVIGYQSETFGRFFASGDESLPLALRADDPATIATTCLAHWQALGQSTGVLVSNSIEQAHALDGAELEHLMAEAEREATERGISGAGRTPFLLARMAERSSGRTIMANIALLRANAQLAGAVARAWSDMDPASVERPRMTQA